MGPPTAGLKTGQFRAGADYSYSNMDFKIDWGDGFVPAKDIKMNVIAANIGYGLTDDWEGFVRLGAGNAKYRNADEEIDFSGNYEFAWGLGTKYTFLKQDKLDWGVLFQIGWLTTKDSKSGTDSGTDNTGPYTEVWKENYKLSVYNMEIAVGPTWKAAEGLSIYGGPFLNITRGKLKDDWKWTDTYEDESTNSGSGSDSADLKERSIFGGYVGAQWEFMQNASLFGEFQYVGTGWTIGTGVGWKF
jgi:hypothetical protein